MSWNYRYEVKQIGEEFAVIRKDWTDVAQYFAGYDFMGSVNWETDSDKAEMNSEDIAWDIVNDLLASDDPAYADHIRELNDEIAKEELEWAENEGLIPKKPEKIVINTDDLMNGLKSFLEAIGCTNVQISSLTPEEIEEKRKNAVEM